MKRLDSASQDIAIEMSRSELKVVANALNEAIEFVPRTEFATRLGETRDTAIALLADVQRVLKEQ